MNDYAGRGRDRSGSAEEVHTTAPFRFTWHEDDPKVRQELALSVSEILKGHLTADWAISDVVVEKPVDMHRILEGDSGLFISVVSAPRNVAITELEIRFYQLANTGSKHSIGEGSAGLVEFVSSALNRSSLHFVIEPEATQRVQQHCGDKAVDSLSIKGTVRSPVAFHGAGF